MNSPLIFSAGISGALRGQLADAALGRVDLLYELLSALELATPDSLQPYIDALNTDTESRPVAEQIIDRLLVEDETRYGTYESIRSAIQGPIPVVADSARGDEGELHEAIGFFLSQWMELERLFRADTIQTYRGRPVGPNAPALQRLGVLHENEEIEGFERIRRLRNNLCTASKCPTLQTFVVRESSCSGLLAAGGMARIA